MSKEPVFVALDIYATSQSTNASRLKLDLSLLEYIATRNFFIYPISDDDYTNLSNNYKASYTNPRTLANNDVLNSQGTELFSSIVPYLSSNFNVPSYQMPQSGGNLYFYPETGDHIIGQSFQRNLIWGNEWAVDVNINYVLYNPQNERYSNCNIGIPSGQNYAYVWDNNGNILISGNQEPAPFGGRPTTYLNVHLFRDVGGAREYYTLGMYGHDYISLYRTQLTYNAASVIGYFFDSTIWNELSTDPYADGGTSTTGGGNGTFDFSSEPIDFPSLPSIGAYNTGFIDIYTPSQSQLQQLAAYMWSGGFDLDAFRRIVADPIDAIMGLSILPVSIPSESATLTVGNISTGLSMPRATTQFVVVDCGTLTVDNKWGAYLDYDPYSKTEIYLPYIGTHAISTDDIMGKTIQVKYYIDIVSGACVALIKCADSVLYSFVGSCSVACPVTNGQYGNVVTSALQIATSIGSMVATGGMSAAQGINDIASAAINTIKPQIEKSGSLGGSGGLLGIQKPYLILTVPRLCTPENQNSIIGYPAYITQTLGDLEGYTVIDDIHLTGIAATDNELTEIETLLKGGVIL